MYRMVEITCGEGGGEDGERRELGEAVTEQGMRELDGGGGGRRELGCKVG